MKCQQCVSEGKRSHVYLGSTMTTLLGCTPDYDENGIFHNDDPNITTTQYNCSNGHAWEERSPQKG